jgi:hypothetical protein
MQRVCRAWPVVLGAGRWSRAPVVVGRVCEQRADSVLLSVDKPILSDCCLRTPGLVHSDLDCSQNRNMLRGWGCQLSQVQVDRCASGEYNGDGSVLMCLCVDGVISSHQKPATRATRKAQFLGAHWRRCPAPVPHATAARPARAASCGLVSVFAINHLFDMGAIIAFSFGERSTSSPEAEETHRREQAESLQAYSGALFSEPSEKEAAAVSSLLVIIPKRVLCLTLLWARSI